jgi:hypothetical protein
MPNVRRASPSKRGSHNGGDDDTVKLAVRSVSITLFIPAEVCVQLCCGRPHGNLDSASRGEALLAGQPFVEGWREQLENRHRQRTRERVTVSLLA